jgi:hypothetical protein
VTATASAEREAHPSAGRPVDTGAPSTAAAFTAGAAVVGIVVLAEAPSVAGYVLGGASFTGTPTPAKYAADFAQHELWAKEMAQHGRFLVNLLTPERTPRGWFFSPLEFVLGVVERASGVPYGVLNVVLALLAAPALAVALVILARRAGLDRPLVPLLVALLAGSFQPLVLFIHRLGVPGWSHVSGVGGGTSPLSAGAWPYLPLAVLVLVLLARVDPARPGQAFRRAALALFLEALIYPFFVPALWLTGALWAFLVARVSGRRSVLTGFAWFTASAAAPMVYYALVLPRVDPEFERFSRLNHVPVLGVGGILTSLGLGLAALVGLPRLLRGNDGQRVLACFTIAAVVAFCLPRHPDRSHILYLNPLLVLAAFAAWWPVLRMHRPGRWHVLAGVATAGALVAAPYYYRPQVESLTPQAPPIFLDEGQRAAFAWLGRRHDDGVVLARSDISPWVAAKANHRVLVGHYLWTHDWEQRGREVDAIFDAGVDPLPVIRRFGVTWVLIDGERGVPAWIRGARPVARLGKTEIFSARALEP